VVPIYPRHPVAMAQAALTLAEITGGRFRLGVGVSHRPTMEAMLGLGLGAPLPVMREYVAVLRGALAGRAEFEGRHFRVHWALGLPDRPAAPPILLAALSPKMLELAGEIADGAVLWLTPPAYVREVAVPALERGRWRAGKTLDGFEIVTAVPLAVTDDPAAALGAFRTELVRYLQLPFYRAMLEQARLGDALKAFDRDGQTPVALAEALGAVGETARCRAYLEAYRHAGATLPAVRPITFPEAPWYRRTLEEAAQW
jgi:alkanesulfonate monooxygenase SsuD/methylene tetrahydromethanopterin reductase-like flavin-dependent oxidoreductase (luciferase family)